MPNLTTNGTEPKRRRYGLLEDAVAVRAFELRVEEEARKRVAEANEHQTGSRFVRSITCWACGRSELGCEWLLRKKSWWPVTAFEKGRSRWPGRLRVLRPRPQNLARGTS